MVPEHYTDYISIIRFCASTKPHLNQHNQLWQQNRVITITKEKVMSETKK